MGILNPKPRAERYRKGLTRLPELHWRRRFVRWLLLLLVKLVVRLLLRPEVAGREHFQDRGPLLVVSNHLGDADVLLGLAYAPYPIEIVAKVELHELPLVGRLMESYGVIWLHRGQPDRKAIRAVLSGLAQGRAIAIAPEGRESVTGGLEEGTQGAAYLALKAEVPLLPVVFTGTENEKVYGQLKRGRRPRVTLRVGPVFHLPAEGERHTAVEAGTRQIMQTLASMLPEAYRGIYKETGGSLVHGKPKI
ncbi:MAG: 1-acyl-sn-glycerol-3-phosphate acyltransferase [Anaerolineales bacterium]|nr:1-acyl-sn-glycerol-3-phosphate acyltransferase [Anaerolineales bacterium]